MSRRPLGAFGHCRQRQKEKGDQSDQHIYLPIDLVPPLAEDADPEDGIDDIVGGKDARYPLGPIRKEQNDGGCVEENPEQFDVGEE